MRGGSGWFVNSRWCPEKANPLRALRLHIGTFAEEPTPGVPQDPPGDVSG